MSNIETIEELKEYISLLEEDLSNERRSHEQDNEEYKMLEQEYETIIEEKNQELIKAKGKIISQDITLASYKDKVGIPILIEGDEPDLYRGEQKDFILNMINNAMLNLDKCSRAYKICQSIVNSNNEVGIRRRTKASIAYILKNYTSMTKDIIQNLRDAGITIEEDGRNHYKLVLFDDDRYTVSISRTPSDNRCGLNATSDINKLFF